METIEQTESIVRMQYVMECLIEYYDRATMESDRYYVKLELLKAIQELNLDIKEVINYLSLQYDKFEPFIKLLANTSQTKKPSNASNPMPNLFKDKPSIKVVIFGERNE